MHNLSCFCTFVRQSHQLTFHPTLFIVQETALKLRDSGSLYCSGTENAKSRKKEYSRNTEVTASWLMRVDFSEVGRQELKIRPENQGGLGSLCHVGFSKGFTVREMENNILGFEHSSYMS